MLFTLASHLRRFQSNVSLTMSQGRAVKKNQTSNTTLTFLLSEFDTQLLQNLSK